MISELSMRSSGILSHAAFPAAITPAIAHSGMSFFMRSVQLTHESESLAPNNPDTATCRSWISLAAPAASLCILTPLADIDGTVGGGAVESKQTALTCAHLPLVAWSVGSLVELYY